MSPEVTEFLLNYLPVIAGILLGVSYIFQIAKLWKTKVTDGISIPFWIVISIALSMLLVNSITIFMMFGTWGYMVTEIFNFGLAVAVLGLVIYYRSKNNKQIKLKQKRRR